MNIFPRGIGQASVMRAFIEKVKTDFIYYKS